MKKTKVTVKDEKVVDVEEFQDADLETKDCNCCDTYYCLGLIINGVLILVVLLLWAYCIHFHDYNTTCIICPNEERANEEINIDIDTIINEDRTDSYTTSSSVENNNIAERGQ